MEPDFMVRQALLRNSIIAASALLWLTACECAGSGGPAVKKENVPSVYVNVAGPLGAAEWKEEGPLLYHNNKLFSGFQYKLYPNKDTAFLYGYTGGKQHGVQLSWYPGKQVQERRNFVHGKQEGQQTGWFINGDTSFIYHFANDVYEGNVKQWYPSGKLFKNFNYKKGQEEGKELLLEEDGSIKANYEVRNGKIYGNIGSKHCASPWKKADN